MLEFQAAAAGEAYGGADNDILVDASSAFVSLFGGTGDDTYVHDGAGLTLVADSSGASDLLLFGGTADLATLQFLQNGDDLVMAETSDTTLSNAVVIDGWFSAADSVDFIANADATQIVSLYDLFA